MTTVYWIVRILRAPRTLVYLIIDKLISPLYFALHGVQSGDEMTIVGLPLLKFRSDGSIKIGKKVKLFSRPTSNPLYIHSPCSFQLIKSGARIEIGDFVAMSGTVICAATQVTIHQRVMIGANCVLTDTDFHPLSPEMRRNHPTDGAISLPIIIEDDVFIGAHAIILKGTTLGAGCIVGAGAVVSGIFPPRSVIVGNPAKAIKQLEDNS